MKIKIIYQTIDNQWHEMTVEESRAQEQMDLLRSLPDVRASTVSLSM